MNWGKVSIGGAGAFGGVIAILGDLIQKQDASAVLKVASTVNRILQLGIGTWAWALVLVILAVALCLVFEPDTKPKAFYVGASILSLLMTAVPFNIPNMVPTPPAAKIGTLFPRKSLSIGGLCSGRPTAGSGFTIINRSGKRPNSATERGASKSSLSHLFHLLRPRERY